MSQLRYALVGAGGRAQMYIDAITGPYAHVAELVAVCDPNPVRASFAATRATDAGAPAPSMWHPDDLEELIRVERVDRVIIAARDDQHAALIIRSLDVGADVIVEKPLTIDLDSAAAIEAAVKRTGGEVLLTFNYRYSPRNSALRRLIGDGEIGAVTSVEFQWLLDTKHGADYFRRWHREKAHSGGLLVHKSSHHFDLVNWWISSIPTRVYASGGLRFYGSENADRRGLEPRRPRGTHNEPSGPFELDLREHPLLTALYLEAERHDGYIRDADVFGEGITIEDNLAVIVDYANGATLSYSLNAHSPWEGYRVAVNGTHGRVELEVVERGAVVAGEGLLDVVDPSAVEVRRSGGLRAEGERLLIQRHWEPASEVHIDSAPGGHGGGDAILLSDIFTGPQADPLGRPADWRDGLRSIAVGISGNLSIESGLPISVSGLGLDALRVPLP